MGNVSKFAFSLIWRAIFIVPIVSALFLFVLNQKIESEELHNIAFVSAITLTVSVYIGAAALAGGYANSRRKFTAYLTSLLMSSLVGISGVVCFLLIIIVAAGQIQSIPSLIKELLAIPQFILVSSGIGVGTAWIFTIATWFERSDE